MSEFESSFEPSSPRPRLPEERLTDLHLDLLRLVADSHALYNNKQIARKVGRKPNTVSYHLSNLDDSGYIKKRSDGRNNYYRLTKRGENVLRSMSLGFELKCRTHDILFTFPIKRLPYDEEWVEGTVFKVNDAMRSWRQLSKHSSPDVVVMVNGESSISVKVKEVWGSSPEGAVYRAFDIALAEVKELIRRHDGFMVGEEVNGELTLARVSKQSHALPRDVSADYAFSASVHISSTETDGRVEVDASHGVPEIEFVDPHNAPVDFGRYMDFLQWLSVGDNFARLREVVGQR